MFDIYFVIPGNSSRWIPACLLRDQRSADFAR